MFLISRYDPLSKIKMSEVNNQKWYDTGIIPLWLKPKVTTHTLSLMPLKLMFVRAAGKENCMLSRPGEENVGLCRMPRDADESPFVYAPHARKNCESAHCRPPEDFASKPKTSKQSRRSVTETIKICQIPLPNTTPKQ